jgi:hypothetical protein
MLIAQSLPPFGPLPEKGKKSTPRFQSNVQYCALSSPEALPPSPQEGKFIEFSSG